MKKLILLSLFSIGLFFLFPSHARAVQNNCLSGYVFSVVDEDSNPPPFKKNPGSNSTLNFIATNIPEGAKYNISTTGCAYRSQCVYSGTGTSSKIVTGTFTFPTNRTNSDIVIKVTDSTSDQNPVCTYTITPDDWKYEISPTPGAGAKCRMEVIQNGVSDPDLINTTDNIIVHGRVSETTGLNNYNISCIARSYCNVDVNGKIFDIFDSDVNNSLKSFDADIGRNWPKGTYNAKAKVRINPVGFPIIFPFTIYCEVDYNVGIPGGVITTYPTPSGPDPYPSLAPLCEQLPGEFRVDCKNCVERQGKIWTAIGCISPDAGEFISEWLLGFGVGIAGAIAFLYFLYGAFLFLTSKGNPEQIGMGREIIISSLLGLALIIFSVFLLRVIAVDVLDLEPFGFG